MRRISFDVPGREHVPGAGALARGGEVNPEEGDGAPDGKTLYVGGHGGMQGMGGASKDSGKMGSNHEARVIDADTGQMITTVTCGVMPVAFAANRSIILPLVRSYCQKEKYRRRVPGPLRRIRFPLSYL